MLSNGLLQLWILRDQGPTAITVQLGLADGTCTEIVKGDVHRAPLDEAHLTLNYSRMPALRRSSNPGWMTVRVLRPRFVHVERILVGCSSRSLFRNSSVVAPPVKDRVDDGLERLGGGGDCILHTRWHLSEYLAANQPVGFEFAKLGRQHMLSDTWDRAPEFSEAMDAPIEQPENFQLPLASDRC
jgi:hypothetical protein